MGEIKDITGQSFGRMVVIGMAPPSPRGKGRCLCRCDCGVELVVTTNSLQRGHTKSCGCLRKERAAQANTKHGMSRSAEYRAWDAMKSRCYRPSNSKYHNYGGRGISVCDEWKDSFEAFLSDMGEKPSPEYTLDRIDGDESYSPDNCRWANKSTQNMNRRHKRSKSGVVGVYQARSGRWVATLEYQGRFRLMKTFDTLFEAAAARKSEENKLNIEIGGT